MKLVALFILQFVVDKEKEVKTNQVKNENQKEKKENKMRVKFPLFMKRNSNQMFYGAKRRDIEFYRDEETPTAEKLLGSKTSKNFLFSNFRI